MDDLKLMGLKSHDCHVLMQDLLPVAICGILPKNVRQVITRLCLFFNAICGKVIDPTRLDELENEAIIILCQLEIYFSPSFFDIMVYLIVHLVREIRLCGLIFLRWMYPIERCIKILKGYMKNPYRPEASIVERYIAEEAIEFCTNYMSEVEAIGVPKSRYEGRHEGKGARGVRVVRKDQQQILQAHLYILNNTNYVLPFLEEHKMLLSMNPRANEKWLLNEHNKTFLKWFKEKIGEKDCDVDELKWLARGPNFDVITWSAYYINKFSFYTNTEDQKSTMQNSGVTLESESMHFASSKDNNPVMATISYFGVIEEIWEVDYVKFRVPVFKCKWVDSNTRVNVDDLGFTLVDLAKIGYKEDPVIMAYQAKQIFYVKDPSNQRWSVVIKWRNEHDVENHDHSRVQYTDYSSLSRQLPPLNEENDVDEVHATRTDHNEGLWENIVTLP